MNKPLTPPYLRAKDAMARLGMKSSAFYELVRQGAFTPIRKAPRLVYYRVEELDAWVEGKA